jgi:Tol biopolymer transport system component
VVDEDVLRLPVLSEMVARVRFIFWFGPLLMAIFLVAGFGRSQTAQFSGTIAFVARIDNRADLYLIKPDGTGRRRLTHDAREEGSPTWAPDGKSLAFIATTFDVGPNHADSLSAISVISANGSKRHALLRARSGQLAFNDLA